jgi:hypothetical protein
MGSGSTRLKICTDGQTKEYTQEKTRLKIHTVLNSKSGFEENPVVD